MRVSVSETGASATRLPGFYHETNDLLKEIEGFDQNCHGLPVRVERREDSDSHVREREALTLLRMGPASAKKVLLAVANVHAREVITSEVVLRFVQRVCQKPGSWPEAEEVLKSGEIQLLFLPVVNVRGRQVVDGGLECLRTTVEEEGGVDLNRNERWSWEAGQSVGEQNHGPRPLSQFQTRIIHELANETGPQVYVDLHSGARSLMVPFGHIPGTGPDYAAQEPLLKRLRRHCPDCRLGSNRLVIGYDNPGEIIDSMHLDLKVRYPMLWEVYLGGGSGTGTGCAGLFNPMHQKSFDETVEAWSDALLTTAEYQRKEIQAEEHTSLETLEMAKREARRARKTSAELVWDGLEWKAAG